MSLLSSSPSLRAEMKGEKTVDELHRSMNDRSSSASSKSQHLMTFFLVLSLSHLIAVTVLFLYG